MSSLNSSLAEPKIPDFFDGKTRTPNYFFWKKGTFFTEITQAYKDKKLYLK